MPRINEQPERLELKAMSAGSSTPPEPQRPVMHRGGRDHG
jgi:hypothetical protein